MRKINDRSFSTVRTRSIDDVADPVVLPTGMEIEPEVWSAAKKVIDSAGPLLPFHNDQPRKIKIGVPWVSPRGPARAACIPTNELFI